MLHDWLIDWLIDWLVFNANFSSISAISWRPSMLKARLHDQSFPPQTWSKFLTEICSKKILSKLSRLHDQSLVQIFIPSYLSVVNSKTSKRAYSEKMFWLVKVYLKIGWVSIPSKSIKVETKFLMENFDRVNGRLQTYMCYIVSKYCCVAFLW